VSVEKLGGQQAPRRILPDARVHFVLRDRTTAARLFESGAAESGRARFRQRHDAVPHVSNRNYTQIRSADQVQIYGPSSGPGPAP